MENEMIELLGSVDPSMLVLGAGGAVLFVATSVGFSTRGPVRWVKVACAMLLADFVVLQCLFVGWQSGLRFVGVTAGAVFAAVSFAFLSWRHPISKVFSPASMADCPAHARRDLEGWTRELEEMGFEVGAEKRTVWQIQGKDRITFVRFLVHHSEPFWVEIHALAEPKVVARMAVSDKADGRSVMTCDRQADQELFDDPLTTIQRVASAARCVDLVDAHRKLAMTSEGHLSRVEDPVRAHVEIYAGWVQRLLASNQVRSVDGVWIALRPGAIPGLVLKTWAAWFH